MAIFYTVDRKNTLSEGLEINLRKYDDVTPIELQKHVNEMFPDGVSCHGEFYFLKDQTRANATSPNIELLFEYVRRANFPDRPSRFQAVFGTEDIEHAKEFRKRFGKSEDNIWKIESNNYFRADMSFLTLNDTLLVYSYFANRYWSGESSDIPLWEVLLSPPIKILKKVYN